MSEVQFQSPEDLLDGVTGEAIVNRWRDRIGRQLESWGQYDGPAPPMHFRGMISEGLKAAGWSISQNRETHAWKVTAMGHRILTEDLAGTLNAIKGAPDDGLEYAALAP